MAGRTPILFLAWIADAPFQNSENTVAATNRHNPKETTAKGCSYIPVTASTSMRVSPAAAGHKNERLRLSMELRRQAISGPTPVRNIRNRAIGTITRLKKGASTLIFSPINHSVRTGNRVPHSTAKQLASKIRLLKRKLDSRETTPSS